jgi:predicted AAA+ superfamily ATPase
MDSWVSFDYQRSERFFARTYLTKAYQELMIEELRRLASQVVDTSPRNKLVAKFGGDNTLFFTLSSSSR